MSVIVRVAELLVTFQDPRVVREIENLSLKPGYTFCSYRIESSNLHSRRVTSSPGFLSSLFCEIRGGRNRERERVKMVVVVGSEIEELAKSGEEERGYVQD